MLFLGWLTGCVAYVGTLCWIVYVVVNYGRMPVYLGIACMLLLVAYLSVYLGLFAAGIVFYETKSLFLFRHLFMAGNGTP